VITITGIIFIWYQTSRGAFARITQNASDFVKIFSHFATMIISDFEIVSIIFQKINGRKVE
jgi:hypothetical protein